MQYPLPEQKSVQNSLLLAQNAVGSGQVTLPVKPWTVKVFPYAVQEYVLDPIVIVNYVPAVLHV